MHASSPSPGIPLTALALALALLTPACGADATDWQPGPEAGPQTVQPPESPPPRETLAATEPGDVRLGNDPRTVTLAVPSRATASEAGSLWLVVEGLRQLRRGVYYEVYLDLPEGQAPDPAGRHFVGNISLYGMERDSEEGAAQAFDVTEKLRALYDAGPWPGELRVTFVRGPAGKDAPPEGEIVSFERIVLERGPNP